MRTTKRTNERDIERENCIRGSQGSPSRIMVKPALCALGSKLPNVQILQFHCQSPFDPATEQLYDHAVRRLPKSL